MQLMSISIKLFALPALKLMVFIYVRLRNCPENIFSNFQYAITLKEKATEDIEDCCFVHGNETRGGR